MYYKLLQIFFLFITFSYLQGNSIYETDAFINIKRMVFYNKSAFILNDAEGLCLSETAIENGAILKKIIKNGNGPFELTNQVDMDINKESIIVVTRNGEFILYNIKKEKLSERKKIKYDPKMGIIFKINFLDSDNLFISFTVISHKSLNISGTKFSHWGIYNLRTDVFKPVWITKSKIEGFKHIDNLNTSTLLYFTHGILDNENVILTYKGANHIFIYNILEDKISKVININHQGYFPHKEKTHHIYGSGVQTPATFVDKGAYYKEKVYFISGGNTDIVPQLVSISSNFKASIETISLEDEFEGHVNLNSTVYNSTLYYWENWGFIGKLGFGFGKWKLTNEK